MYKLIKEQEALWQHLTRTDKPIYIYGMGDGAVKIISVLEKLGVPIAGIYASNDFVRGHSFYNCRVMTFKEVKAQSDAFISLLAFAAFREPMLDTLYAMQEECEFYAPDVPVCKENDDDIFDLNYVDAHQAELEAVYEILADDWSRHVFQNVLNFKISGKLDYLKAATSPVDEVYMSLIKPTVQDCYVDLGAYNGDTVSEMLCFAGGSLKEITAFEPDAKNYRRLQKRIDKESIANITTHNVAAWSHADTLHFSGKGGRNAKLDSEGTIAIPADSVDNRVQTPISIIKYDVEGAEYEAITGCRRAIEQYTPRLMVSAYHRNSDLYQLPLYVKSINPAYKVYLRHHPYIPAWETNFYFAP